jgi:hypothetical protein
VNDSTVLPWIATHRHEGNCKLKVPKVMKFVDIEGGFNDSNIKLAYVRNTAICNSLERIHRSWK